MSFIPTREKIFLERLKKAQDVREFKERSHSVMRKVSETRKDSLERSGENIQRLENTLRQIYYIREKRNNVKDEFMNSKRHYEIMALKDKIKKMTHSQDKKLKFGVNHDKDFKTDSQSPTDLGSSKAPMKSSVFSPSYLRSILRF